MAGHSKWANIKRRKGAADSARGQLFTKLIKEVQVAARVGGGDPDANPRLRQAIDKCKANSVPKANVEKAIAKAIGDTDGADYETLLYEGYGPGGVAILVECLTDNRNRTAAEVRHAFTKGNGNLGSSGSVAYIFDKKGVFSLPFESVDEDTVMMAAMEGEAEEIERDGDEWSITCALSDYDTCKRALEELGVEELKAELSYLPDSTITISNEDAVKLMGLIDRIDDLDDVQETYTNADFDESALD